MRQAIAFGDPVQPVLAEVGGKGLSLIRMTHEAFLSWRAGWPGDVVGTTLEAHEDFRSVRYRAPALLVMGSEGPGLSEPVAKACTRLVKIPLAGRHDSLNLAVATALMLYQIRGPELKL